MKRVLEAPLDAYAENLSTFGVKLIFLNHPRSRSR